MIEDADIISQEVKKTSLKDFFLNNKKSIFAFVILILLALFVYFFYVDYKKDQKILVSDKYNLAVIKYNKDNSDLSISEMKNIINIKDPTYSPLALYFLLDNNLLSNKKEINKYFDILIEDVKLDKEIMNLLIYKKGLYNSDNLWKSHSLYILAEYFFSKNEKKKSKEFFEKILELENPNPQIKLEAQKRLQRDFSV